jgi:EmrB/QacA subfamily drug resistance transporter
VQDQGNNRTGPDRATRLRIILGGILASFLAALDTTALATVMPTMVAELGGLRFYSWVFAVYMIMSALSMPLWGKLSDVYGKKRLFFATVSMFLLGSILCGLSQNMVQLIVFRAIQGIGAGGLSSVPFALVSTVFPPHERGKALGVLASAWGISSVLGPLVGSAIVMWWHWRWVFYINVPIGAAAVTLVALHYRDLPRHQRMKIDYLGAMTLCCAILFFLLGIMRNGMMQQVLPQEVFLAAAAVFAVLFISVERRAAHPVLELQFFKRRTFWATNILGFLASFAIYGIITYMPLFAQTVGGGGAIRAAVVITPMSLSWSTASITAGRYAHAIGEARLIRLGMLLMAAGLFAALFAGAESPLWFLSLCVILIGGGMGCQTPALMLTVQKSLEQSNVGVATSTQMLARTLGGAVGVSIMGSALVDTMERRLLQAFPNGFRIPLDDPQKLLEPQVRALMTAPEVSSVLSAFADGMHAVVLTGLVTIALSGLISYLLPRHAGLPRLDQQMEER